jgi:putative SOS response-associated peptidase YedK
MCGRFTIRVETPEVVDALEVGSVTEAVAPSYNVAPGTGVPVVVLEDGVRVLMRFRWGLIPSWAKDPTIGNRLINARGETVAEKPAFRKAFAQRRCLIPADGFYEWKAGPAGKEPWYITLRDRPVFAFAGLWERWHDPEGEEVLSCAIITIAANDFMKPIHHRMPVILPASAEARWLDPALKDRATLEALLRPYPSNLMQAHAVARTVNSPRNDSEQCVLPLE